jgi:predicted transcriptional regulator
VELIRHHLSEQNEPRSATEISTALGQAHPERDIKTKVVRITLEGLVAKSQAQRTKQGASVFYTAAPSAPGPTTAPAAEEQPEDADR